MSVVSIKKVELKKRGYRDLEHWLETDNHIYIGRNLSFYVKGATQSKWANPFSIRKYGREDCLKKYKEYILSNEDLMSKLNELKGKILGCWCHPESCHGDILIKLLQIIEGVQREGV